MNAVIIVDYDQRWPAQFETLRSRLASVLNGLTTNIEHVGSTAVPGLAAKPIIDIDVPLRSAADFPRAVTALAAIGYQHEDDLGIPGREAFRAPTGDPLHHLYVCPTDTEYRRHVAFRDHLRMHSEDADVYAALKRRLVLELGEDREAYTKTKSEFVERILRKSASKKVLSKLAVFSVIEKT